MSHKKTRYRIVVHGSGYVVEKRVFFFGWIWDGPSLRYVFSSVESAERYIKAQLREYTVIKEFEG